MALVSHSFVAAPRGSSKRTRIAQKKFHPFAPTPSLLNAPRIPFRHFNNRYAKSSCYIIGRGPTDFDYHQLSEVPDPVFFINDAVCLAKYVKSETFFFAHDAEMRVWLDGSLNATAVLPIESKVLADAPRSVPNHSTPTVSYHRKDHADRDLLQLTRDELAEREELFVHSGTMHSLLHFAWFCGFDRAICIGCDGRNPTHTPHRALGADPGYDHRLENRSRTISGPQYSHIRMAQDLLATLFKIEITYCGTLSRHTGLQPAFLQV